MSVGRIESAEASSFRMLRKGKTDRFRGLWKHLALQIRLTIAFSGGRVYITGRAESP